MGTVWLWTAAAAAQVPSPTGNVYGTALDADGSFVPGVAVTLTGPGAVRTTETDRRGDFHFLDLSPGDYSVALERSGFQMARRDVTVVLGKNAVLAFTLTIAGMAETVTVDAPSSDSRNVQTGATFGEQELLAIPTGRDPWAFLRQVPGVIVKDVVVGPTTGRPAFVGKGSPPSQNNFNLDGVAISVGGRTPLLFDFDSFDGIEVTTGGSDLSLATPGVTVNLVTKRGTNQLRGSARALYTGATGWDYGAEAGGPVWRDRAWLWGSFAKNDSLSSTRHLDADETVTSQEALRYWNAKLNAQLAKSNTLTLSHNDMYRTLTVVGEPSSAADGSAENVRPAKSNRVQDAQVLSAASFLSGYVSYVTASTTDTPIGGVDEQAFQDEHGNWHRSTLLRRVSQDERQAGLNASTFFHTGNLGHELKFGFGYRDVRFGDAERWPGDQLVGYGREFDDGTRVAQVTRAQNPKSLLHLYDAFLGDTVSAGRLTVNAGLRFDYQQGKNVPSDVGANPVFPELLPAVHYAGDAGYPITWRLFQPRVGATYALGEGRTLLRASYSRFVDSLDSNTIFALNPFPGIATLEYFWTDANRNDRVEKDEVDQTFVPGPFNWFNVDPNDPGASVQVNRLAKGFKPPTTDEVIVGVERQIAPDLSGSLAYTYRSIHNLAFSPLIGTTRDSYQYFGNATGSVTADRSAGGITLGFDVPYYGLIDCPDPCIGTELQNRPDAHETYSGVEVQLIKSFSHGWMARVSFAYNDWQQHIGSGAIINPNDVSPGVNSSGPVFTATWQFNVSGSVELPLGVSAGLNVFGRQGFPIAYFVDVQTNDSAIRSYGLQVGKLGDHRLPDVYQLDLQIARPFQLGPITIIPQFACFNLLDSHTVLDRNGRMGGYDAGLTPAFEPDPFFNGVFEEMHPRVYRGGVRIAF